MLYWIGFQTKNKKIMSRKERPYLPLYVQDFLTDEKLIECSASATGIYIRLMCILHKQEEYGKILLKQKDKQNKNNIKNFAKKLFRQMPYSIEEIEASLFELLDNDVIQIDLDSLMQKRMVDDGKLSDVRADAGKKGKIKSLEGNKKKIAKTKSQANTDNKIANDVDNNKRNYPEKFSEKFKAAFESFIDFRKEIKKPFKSCLSIKKQLNWLEKYDEKTAIAIIDQSIRNGYQGLFELNNNNTNAKKNDNNRNSKTVATATDHASQKL